MAGIEGEAISGRHFFYRPVLMLLEYRRTIWL